MGPAAGREADRTVSFSPQRLVHCNELLPMDHRSAATFLAGPLAGLLVGAVFGGLVLSGPTVELAAVGAVLVGLPLGSSFVRGSLAPRPVLGFVLVGTALGVVLTMAAGVVLLTVAGIVQAITATGTIADLTVVRPVVVAGAYLTGFWGAYRLWVGEGWSFEGSSRRTGPD